jgi:hypothetical protein
MEEDRFSDESGDKHIVYIPCDRCDGDGWIEEDEESCIDILNAIIENPQLRKGGRR